MRRWATKWLSTSRHWPGGMPAQCDMSSTVVVKSMESTAEVSTDGKVWKKVLDFSDNKIPATAAGHSGTFPKADARYVKIHVLKNSANAWVHIVEVIVNEAK